MSILRMIVLFITVTCSIAKPTLGEPAYTQNLETFNSDRRNHRMQMTAGCWLVVMDEYDRISKENNNSVTNDTTANATENAVKIDAKLIGMVKKCLKKITLKEAVNKVAALVDKNMTVPKTFLEVVQTFSQEDINEQFSPFDNHLAEIFQNFTTQLATLRKGSIKEVMEQQLRKKSTPYLFGLIPLNNFTKTTALILITVALVSCCTCWKVYKKTGERRAEKREKQRLQKQVSKKKGSKKMNDIEIAQATSEPGILPLKKKRL